MRSNAPPPVGQASMRDAGEADGQPEDRDRTQPHAAPDAVEQRKPERCRPDHQRCDAGRHALLGERHETERAAQEAAADDRRAAPLDERRPRDAAAQGDREQDRSGDREARRQHQERRQRPARLLETEIGRAPDHVQDRQRAHDGEPGAPRQTITESARSRRFRFSQPCSVTTHDVLEPHAAEALAVEPGLDGHDVAGPQRLVAAAAEARLLVHGEADAVAEAVRVARDRGRVDAGRAARRRVAGLLEQLADERVECASARCRGGSRRAPCRARARPSRAARRARRAARRRRTCGSCRRGSARARCAGRGRR